MVGWRRWLEESFVCLFAIGWHLQDQIGREGVRLFEAGRRAFLVVGYGAQHNQRHKQIGHKSSTFMHRMDFRVSREIRKRKGKIIT